MVDDIDDYSAIEQFDSPNFFFTKHHFNNSNIKLSSYHKNTRSAFLSYVSSQPPAEKYESGSNLMFDNEIDRNIF